METDPPVGVRPWGPILQVSLDRASYAGELAADLVMAPSHKAYCHYAIPFSSADRAVLEPRKLCFPAWAFLNIGLVGLLVACHPVFKLRFGGVGCAAGQCKVGFVDLAVAEHRVHPFQGLGCLGQDRDAAYRPVQAVRYAEEHLPRLAVAFCNECLEGLGDRFVTGLVALYDVSHALVDYQQVVVFIQDEAPEVAELLLCQVSVSHISLVVIGLQIYIFVSSRTMPGAEMIACSAKMS